METRRPTILSLLLAPRRRADRPHLPGLKAVVVALQADLSFLKLKKHGEVRLHLRPFGQGAQGNGEDTRPDRLRGDPLSLGDGRDELVALPSKHFFCLVRCAPACRPDRSAALSD